MVFLSFLREKRKARCDMEGKERRKKKTRMIRYHESKPVMHILRSMYKLYLT